MNIKLGSREAKRLFDLLREKYDLSRYKISPNTRINFFHAIPTSSEWGHKNSPVPYKVVQIMARSKVQDILRDFESICYRHVVSLTSTNWPCPKLKYAYPKEKEKNCYLLEIWSNRFCVLRGFPGKDLVPQYMISLEGVKDYVFFLY